MQIGDVWLAVRADLSQFQASLAGLNSQVSRSATDMGKSLSNVGKGLTSTGSALTRNLTLPLVAAGLATTHFALDFDTKMRQIVALSDITQGEIGGIREQILKLGPAIGKSPQELADAFYYLASSGLSAEESMKALTIAGKASATGMGLTSDIAKVLAGVINAYGHENITAARAGDILTAAVKDGAAEASDFAGSIGRVVPVAAALGVTFDQVSAALAGMTLVGVSTDEATTSLVQIFSALLKPSVQAEAAMKSLGLSSAGLRDELKGQGLIATLRTLQSAFGDNETAASAVFGNIRALRGVTALLTLDDAQLNKVFRDTNGALGDLNQAYADTEGPQRKLDKAFADLQASAIALGTDVLPQVVELVQGLAEAVRRLSRWWGDLSADQKKSIVQFLAFSAVIGPILLIVGKLVSGLGALFKAIGFLSGAKGIPALIGGITKARLGMALWLTVILGITAGLEAAAGPISDFFDTLTEGKKANKTLHELNDLTGDMMKAHALRIMGIDAKGFAQAIEAAGGDADYAFNAIKDDAGDLGKALDQLRLDADPTHLFPGWGTRDPTKIEAALAAARAKAAETPGDLAASLENGQFVVAPAAVEMVAPIDDAVQKEKQKVADAANDLIATLASTLSATHKDLEDAAQKMWDEILHPFPDIKRRAGIEAILASSKIAEGLRSSDSKVRADTATYVKGLLDQYEEMAPGALAAGQLVNPALQKGINSNLAMLTTYLNGVTGGITSQFDLADELDLEGYHSVAQYIRGMEAARSDKLATTTGLIRRQTKADLLIDGYSLGYDVSVSYAEGLRVGGYVAINKVQDYTGKIAHLLALAGSPDYTHSREAGEGVGRTWLEELLSSLRSGLPKIGAAVSAIASAMSPQLAMGVGMGVPSMSGAAAGGSTISAPAIGGSVVNNYNLYVTGKLPVDDAQDALTALRRLAGIKKD